ncbi:hypothetical protein D9615_006629 [Tricholomella constricta]|uniref:Uncharacterized protein n=1 Tax=Tricholomella constricta TaxID=117010 RepID=A0A8H5H9U5_9AGAR|nr:hypothetical protein D9615_006629 [Tricholomella constricta]
MDSPIHPPVRLQPISTLPLSARRTQKELDRFLDNFQARSTASHDAGNAAVTVQLQKLREALQEERSMTDATSLI